MHTIQLTAAGDSSKTNAAELVLREAKRLHRAATSDSLSNALPVLRRLLAAGTVPHSALPDLFRRRSTLQRKHVLRALAVEAGFRTWEEYRPVLGRIETSELTQLEVVRQGAGCLNHWFTNEVEAHAFALLHGGRPVRVGSQAVVLPVGNQ